MLKTLPPIIGVNNRTFVIDSCDEVVGTVLKQHGWKQISTASLSWNLKWTWKADNKAFEALQNGQFINHFPGSDQITTKLGLSLLYKKNPRILDSGKCFQTFYPRSFNLSTQKQEFITNFIQTGILNLLKKIVVCLELFHPSLYEKAKSLKQKIAKVDTEKILKQMFNNQQISVVQHNLSDNFRINGKLVIRLLFYLQDIFSLEQSYQFKRQELIELVQYGKQEIPFLRTHNQITPSINLLSLLLIYHEKCMKAVTNFYQDGFSNIWIVKSNHSSRGRNIVLVDKLEDIEAIDNGMKLIQKYIENIWVLHEIDSEKRVKYPQIAKLIKKKFDIRFWVLVKSFNPLVIYIYDEAYLRISAESYRLDILTEKQAHLTNYSINWKRKESVQSCSYVLFSKFLKFLSDQQQVQPTLVRHKIDTIIKETLKLVQMKKDQRCFELFGFDIILDAKLNPWILQCNMSPACAPRGELKQLVKSMTTGLLTILGFIDSGMNGWRQLHSEKSSEKLKQSASCQNFRETCQSFRKGENIIGMKTTLNNWNQSYLHIKKLDWKKYKCIERSHYYVEKILLIQRFFRKKLFCLRKKSNTSFQKKNVNKCLKILQLLARLAKKQKTQLFKCLKLSNTKKSKHRNKFRISF